MSRYIALVKFTSSGLAAIKQSPERLEAVKSAAKAYGGSIEEFYLTLGRYDMIIILDMPTDEAGASFSLAIASKGAVTIETLRAFDEDTYREIVAKVP